MKFFFDNNLAIKLAHGLDQCVAQESPRASSCRGPNIALLIAGMRLRFLRKSDRSRAFTLVEIMIVVAIIAILASIALAWFIRARKRTQATRVLNDLRVIDAAIDQYAVDNNKTAGMNPVWSDLQVYTKKNTNLYSTGADVFGQTYGPFTVDTLPMVPSATKTALSDVADTSFWSPYQ